MQYDSLSPTLPLAESILVYSDPRLIWAVRQAQAAVPDEVLQRWGRFSIESLTSRRRLPNRLPTPCYSDQRIIRLDRRWGDLTDAFRFKFEQGEVDLEGVDSLAFGPVKRAALARELAAEMQFDLAANAIHLRWATYLSVTATWRTRSVWSIIAPTELPPLRGLLDIATTPGESHLYNCLADAIRPRDRQPSSLAAVLLQGIAKPNPIRPSPEALRLAEALLKGSSGANNAPPPGTSVLNPAVADRPAETSSVPATFAAAPKLTSSSPQPDLAVVDVSAANQDGAGRTSSDNSVDAEPPPVAAPNSPTTAFVEAIAGGEMEDDDPPCPIDDDDPLLPRSNSRGRPGYKQLIEEDLRANLQKIRQEAVSNPGERPNWSKVATAMVRRIRRAERARGETRFPAMATIRKHLPHVYWRMLGDNPGQ